jgi:putative aminopeptidase FrvX
MKDFLLEYISRESPSWESKPEIIHGPDFQDCILLRFGQPRTAIFAHMDSVGFTVRYQNQLVAIGGPDAKTGYKLCGSDSLGPIECTLEVNEENQLSYNFGRAIDTGTDLVFHCEYRDTRSYVQSCYLDNRLGVYNALKVCESLKDGYVVFSCWEEHGGGSVPYLAKYIYERDGVRQALISDITWVTDGVQHGNGTVISIRDRGIPRREYIQQIIHLAQSSGSSFQLEVEGSGSSDARELQASPYPFDWCFIGAPESNVHSPDEKVHKKDIDSMIQLYQHLMKEL